MAIKIAGTEVVGVLRNPTNITDTVGLYTRLSTGATIATTPPSSGATVQFNMNFNGSFGHKPYRDYWSSTELAGPVTWRLAGAEPGAQMILFVDASVSGHDQNFSTIALSGTGGGTIRYPNDAEPDWTLARYWMHCITVWNNSEISVISTSWSS
jgi:hypothetical protein